MLYAITGEDIDDSVAARAANRTEHIERLTQLNNEGRLILAGPFPAIDNPDPGPNGFTGSLIVAEFDSLDAATQWANADAYATGGVFNNVTVKPFKQVFPSA